MIDHFTPRATRIFHFGRVQGMCVGINLGTALINATAGRWWWMLFSLVVAGALFKYSDLMFHKIYDETRN
jgi:uncharacterized membrane protein